MNQGIPIEGTKTDTPVRQGSPPGALALEILRETSPELAIKVAYDFARKLRIEGADETEYPDLLRNNVEEIFSAMPLLLYVRAGFRAGFFFQPFPWRRDIEGNAGSET